MDHKKLAMWGRRYEGDPPFLRVILFHLDSVRDVNLATAAQAEPGIAAARAELETIVAKLGKIPGLTVKICDKPLPPPHEKTCVPHIVVEKNGGQWGLDKLCKTIAKSADMKPGLAISHTQNPSSETPSRYTPGITIRSDGFADPLVDEEYWRSVESLLLQRGEFNVTRDGYGLSVTRKGYTPSSLNQAESDAAVMERKVSMSLKDYLIRDSNLGHALADRLYPAEPDMRRRF